jgi:hypothetical protein
MYPIRVPPAPALVYTASGANLPSNNNPTVIAQLGLAVPPVYPYLTLRGFQFQTPQLEWATVRVVGFQVSTMEGSRRIPPPGPVILFDSFCPPQILVKNLLVGSGANLFPQEDYQDSAVYSTSVPEYAGLRAYPVVQMPNQVTVDVALAGQTLGFTTFSCATIVEVLDDEGFGRHIPGPYARRDALARRAPRNGTGFLV